MCAPPERFVWVMLFLLVALVGVLVLEGLYILVVHCVSAELATVISALSGSIVTAFLMGKQK